MLTIGSTRRSEKMNAITPPKLLPPFQRIAASGTFPTEHTKDSIAMMGPTIGPHNFVSQESGARKNTFQNAGGTEAASVPAISTPAVTSFHTDTQSIT